MNAGKDASANGEVRGRVLLVAPQPFYEDRGTPIAVMQLLRALSELGYGVDVLTFPVGQDFELPNVRCIRTPNPLRFRSVPIGLSPRKVVLDLLLARELRRLLGATRYDVVHAVEEAAFLAAPLCRRRGIPLLYDMQSSLPEQLQRFRVFRPQPVRRALDRCERWLLERANMVVSSTGLADHVRTVVPKGDVREWLFFAPPPNVPSPREDAALRAELDIPAGAPVVLYTGTFEPYQGLPTLVEAIPLVLARVPAAVFVLVGHGGGPSPLDGLGSVEGLRRSGSLRILGRKPREEMPRYLALADVLVSPRAYGGNLPLKIFDYLRAGGPIVASDIPTHRSLLDESRAVLVPPDAAGIAGGILRVLEYPEYAGRLRQASWDFAERNLGWDNFVAAVEQWYEGVLASPPVASRAAV